MRRIEFFLIAVFLLFVCGGYISIPIYLDDTRGIEERVEDALNRMTLQEKIAMVHAQSSFSSPGVKRLGIPEIWTTDGPHGIRAELFWGNFKEAGWGNDSCVAFPALTALAATWNREMAYIYGKSIGEEARYRNKTILLGPGVNIYRTPLNGRNFEYMGEDPFLASELVVPYVRGVQQNGVAACVKHYALNNNEKNRHTTNVIVDDRALNEIYLPAFKAAVTKGKVWSIMGAYNLFQGQHCSHHHRLLNQILKQDWGFDGVVVSDWGATHDSDEAIRNGLDLEFDTKDSKMPKLSAVKYDNYFLAHDYLNKIQQGKYGTEELDDKVRRILRLSFRTNMNRARPYGSMLSKEHYDAAQQIAEEGFVLLKNEGILPISRENVKRILVVGENAVRMMTAGGGSSALKAQIEVTPLQGIMELVDESIDVCFARGYKTEDYEGAKVMAGYSLEETRSDEELAREAVDLAKNADYVLFFGGLNKAKKQDCEGHDRLTMSLPANQDALIDSLLQVNKHLIFVNISGNAVAMPWVGRVPAICQAWYLGSKAGTAIARILFGEVNPSGKLPFSFPVSLDRSPAHVKGDYPGTKKGNVWDMVYREGIFVGYRWFDTFDKNGVLFPFGHGLSYTKFMYEKPSIDRQKMGAEECVKISVLVKNIGMVAGKEVVQLYVGDKKSSLPRPVKELKAFQKVDLAPGESELVTFVLDRNDLSFFNDRIQKWVAEPGEFELFIGSSSVDIRGKVKIVYTGK